MPFSPTLLKSHTCFPNGFDFIAYVPTQMISMLTKWYA